MKLSEAATVRRPTAREVERDADAEGREEYEAGKRCPGRRAGWEECHGHSELRGR
jgi:hypothetical protein